MLLKLGTVLYSLLKGSKSDKRRVKDLMFRRDFTIYNSHEARKP